MAFSDLPLVGFLKTKMAWHQARQAVLAENVANADMPQYRPFDLKPMSFEPAPARMALRPAAAARTDAKHLASRAMAPEQLSFETSRGQGWEITPDGNSVVLEEQMMKIAANQFDFQLASSLYSRSLGLIKTALGRG